MNLFFDIDELNTIAQLAEKIRQVNAAYLALDRSDIDASQLLNEKFSHAFWRGRILDYLLEKLSGADTKNQSHIVESILALNVFIPSNQLKVLDEALCDQNLFSRVIVNQGVRLKDSVESSAGPGIDLKISANTDSHWPFEKWREIKAFSEYEFEGDGVHFRDVFFRPGDILLSNVNRDGNGVYTALSDPKNFCSHSSVVVIIPYKGRQFPAVLETYEKGVRAVPLNVVLGPRYSSYTEIVRHKDLQTHHTEKINAAALQIVRYVKGYNFDTEDPDRNYMSCTSIGRFMLLDAGLSWIDTQSRIAQPQIVKNLGKMGYIAGDFFAPIDYLLSQDMSLVGVVDNNQLDRLVVRELIDACFRAKFSEKELVSRKFPLSYHINLWGIRHLRKNTAIGKIVSLVEGFNQHNLPKGPDRVMASIQGVESQLARAIKALHPHVKDYLNNVAEFDYDTLMGQRALVERAQRLIKLPWLV